MDPISLEPLRSLRYAPFELRADHSLAHATSSDWFDGAVLAAYLIQAPSPPRAPTPPTSARHAHCALPTLPLLPLLHCLHTSTCYSLRPDGALLAPDLAARARPRGVRGAGRLPAAAPPHAGAHAVRCCWRSNVPHSSALTFQLTPLATCLVQRLRRDAPELEDVTKTKTKVMVEDGCVAHAFDHRAEYGRAGTGVAASKGTRQ